MQKRPLRHPETAYRSVGDEGGLVVLPIRSEVKVLNPVATKIYGMLDGTHTLDEIAAAVVEEFDVGEEQARTDVHAFIAQLTTEGLVADDSDGDEGKQGMSELNPYSKLVHKAFAEALPMSCQMEITYRCNHLCTFCYNSPSGEREMTTPQIFEALEKISKLGVLYMTLTGGEALCHKDFFKIANEVRRLGMALRIYSNGYLLSDKKMVRKIRALNPMEVEISIHGATAESHEALTRIKGSFARTVQGLKNLNEAGLKVNLKCAITRLNQHELFEVKALGDSLGLMVNFDAVITPKDDGNQDPLDLRADEEFIERYWGEWYDKLHNGRMPPRANHCAADATANCGSARSGLTVDPYGNILPCVALRRSAGNILETDDLPSLWRHSPVLNGVRDLAVDARKELDKHENGKYFTFCMGVAETQAGDPLAMYPQAEINARAVRRHYELLQIEDAETGQKTA